jgi:hypothetical protein
MKISIPGVQLSKVPPKVNVPRFAPAGDEKSGQFSARGGHGDYDDRGPNSGGAGAGAAVPFGHTHSGVSSKKVAKVEPVHMPGYDDRIGHHDGDADEYANERYEEYAPAGGGAGGAGGGYDEDDSHLPYTERKIKPKSNTYEVIDGGIDDDPNSFKTGGGPSKPVETFPEGQHPLEYVPEHLKLPTPEALGGKSKYVGFSVSFSFFFSSLLLSTFSSSARVLYA